MVLQRVLNKGEKGQKSSSSCQINQSQECSNRLEKEDALTSISIQQQPSQTNRIQDDANQQIITAFLKSLAYDVYKQFMRAHANNK